MMTEQELEWLVAEAIYDAVPQWGSLGAKTEEIKAQYAAMACAAIKVIAENDPTR